jgi:hypothetical protein
LLEHGNEEFCLLSKPNFACAVNAWDCAVARSETLCYTPMCVLRSPIKPRLRNGYFLQIRPIGQLPQ